MIHNHLCIPNAPADARRWEIRVDGNTLEIAVINDARSTASHLRVERIGARIVRVELDGTEMEARTRAP